MKKSNIEYDKKDPVIKTQPIKNKEVAICAHCKFHRIIPGGESLEVWNKKRGKLEKISQEETKHGCLLHVESTKDYVTGEEKKIIRDCKEFNPDGQCTGFIKSKSRKLTEFGIKLINGKVFSKNN